MAYLSGPTFTQRGGSLVTRRDYVAALDALELAMPGYRFCHDRSTEGGIRMLDFPGYRWGRRDLLFLLCVLHRCLRRRCPPPELVLAVKAFIGPVDCFFAGMGRDSPYKVMRFHGFAWPWVDEASRHRWAQDGTTPLTRGAGALHTCLKAFRGAPPWTAEEVEQVCRVLQRVWGVVPEYWRPGRPFVTQRLRRALLKSRGLYM